MKKTVLHSFHESYGAKIVPFAGYLMPIQYQGIITEHLATRAKATVFDTCHMGEYYIYDGNALIDLENLLTCHIDTMEIGQCRYGLICNKKGGVIDDQVIYRLDKNRFFMVVNAVNKDFDLEWIRSHISKKTRIEDASDNTAKIDLQGPESPQIMQKLMEDGIDDMKFYYFKYNKYKDKEILISRTGYTGEVGFEIYCDNELGIALWNDCIECGAKPAGLGARDTLRLEMGFPLYGHELSSDWNAAESGLMRHIATDKEFIGSKAALDVSQRVFSLAGMILNDRRAARAHDTVFDMNGKKIGFITSGSFSPSIGKAIAMGYIHKSSSEPGTVLSIKTERNELKATIHQTPLYKKGTWKKNLDCFL
ncbi:MAG: glycine cleavage system aminomethyltransferase GcvT [Thermodesulfobacteriota bacterium]|nr:glycine cleavage system aminomethyltransferase GcvT [Thermodesulfobacteriota bacterium]